MPRIPMIEKQLVGYKMPFVVVMEPQEPFTSRRMRRPNVWARLSMRAEPLEVELEGRGDNALKGTLANL